VTVTLDNPGAVLHRLEEIERDLAIRQGAFEAAALGWFRAKRNRERERALAFIAAQGTVAERNAIADRDTAMLGAAEEAEYEALKAVVRTLETRSAIGMSILKSQTRIGHGA
jgi:hypothetical protein